jgi:acetyl esterase
MLAQRFNTLLPTKETYMINFRSTATAATVLALTATASAISAPVLEPTTQKFLDGLVGSPPIYTLTPQAARELLRGAQSGSIDLPPVSIADRVLPAGPTGQTRIRVLRPENASQVLPVIVYFHGAGWVMGDTKTHDRLVREIATGAHAAVVFVDYDRSPESRYPAAIEQDYAVLAYVAEHPKEFNVDSSRLAIAGDSVGGNMTAVVSLLAKERKGPAIKAQVLFYPVTDAAMSDGSYQTFADGPWLTKPAMSWFWNAYLPDVAGRENAHVSPLNATSEQLKGLPPALVITAENDVLRDEGEAYGRKLSEAGVAVTSTRYNGTIHDFVMLNALAETPAARAAIAQANAFLQNALTR